MEIGGRALDILIALAERAGETISRKELEARAWPGVIVEESNLRTQIAGLRRLLGEHRGGTRYIASVRGRGYCLVVPVARTSEVGATVPAAQQEPQPRARWTLPPRLDRMVGRGVEIADVKAHLLGRRFVSIVGPGGMGKTTLASRVAAELAQEFAGHVAFVDLASIEEPSLVADTIAAGLGLTLQSSEPTAAVLALLESQRLLLVLDNCEHVISAAAMLAERIHLGAPEVHILATSREPLRVEGEQIYPLAPLASPEESWVDITAAQALTFPAVQLFMERAAAAGHRAPLRDAEAVAVTKVCRRLDGNPFALELAAARVAAHGIEGTAALMDQRFKLLWAGRRTAPPRHQTLATLLDWSYNLLTEDEATALRRLSVFVGTFSLEAADAVAGGASTIPGQMAEIIASLTAKSLISSYVRDGRLRYRLLEVTREYVAEKLNNSPESEAIHRRHATYFACYEMDPSIFPIYTDYLGNLRAALEWCLGRPEENRLLQDLVHRIAKPLLRMSLLTECQIWCERALSSLPQTDRCSIRELDLLKSLAISSMFTRGNDADVRAVIARALWLAELLGDHAQRLQLLTGLNIFQIRQGDFEGALRSAQQSAPVAHGLADPGAVMIADWMLAVAHHLRGDQRLAQMYYERGIGLDEAHPESLSQSFGYDHRVRALVGLARTLWLRGAADRAVTFTQRACEAAAALGQPVTTCIALIYSATVHLWRGDWSSVETAIDAGLAESRRHSLRPYHAVCSCLKGELLLRRGDPAAAIELMRPAIEGLTNERHFVLTAGCRTALAEALAAVGEMDAALATIEQAIAQNASGASFEMPEILRVKACILLSHPQPRVEEAMGLLDHAMQLAQSQSAIAWSLRIAMSRVQARPHDARARNELQAIRARFTEGFTSADLLLADRLLDSAPAARFPVHGALRENRRRRRSG